MRIKKNDQVIILTGKERGMTGRVLSVMPKKDRVIVEGRNIVQRHVRPGMQGQEGGIIPKEASLHVSNVALYSEAAGGGVRVRTRFRGAEGELFTRREDAEASFGDGGGKAQKVRFSPKTGEVFD